MSFTADVSTAVTADVSTAVTAAEQQQSSEISGHSWISQAVSAVAGNLALAALQQHSLKSNIALSMRTHANFNARKSNSLLKSFKSNRTFPRKFKATSSGIKSSLPSIFICTLIKHLNASDVHNISRSALNIPVLTTAHRKSTTVSSARPCCTNVTKIYQCSCVTNNCFIPTIVHNVSTLFLNVESFADSSHLLYVTPYVAIQCLQPLWLRYPAFFLALSLVCTDIARCLKLLVPCYTSKCGYNNTNGENCACNNYQLDHEWCFYLSRDTFTPFTRFQKLLLGLFWLLKSGTSPHPSPPSHSMNILFYTSPQNNFFYVEVGGL